MLITPANMSGFFTAFETLFWSAYQGREPFWSKIATMIPSGTEQNTYGWMGKIPTLREWIGERQVQNAATKSYTIVNKPFELTLTADRHKIEDDNFGLYNPMVTEMGWQSKKWPDYRIVDTIQANGTWADGVSFFSTAHPVDVYDASKGTYANDFTSSTLNYDNYRAGRASMMAYKGEDGKPLGIMPNLVVVPPQLEGQGKHILESDFLAPPAIGSETGQVGATTNVYKGSAQLLVLPELANQPTVWYMLDTTRAIKPFIWQLRKSPEFVARVNPADPRVFDLHEFVYGVDARGEAGFGHPWLAARFTA